VSVFTTIVCDLPKAETELASFKAWLGGVSFIGETAIVAEISQRPQMACLLSACLGLAVPNLIKFELQMKGIFRTDLVLGNDGRREFAFIEFEDAETNSIFKNGTKQYRYWAPRIEHGFSQVVDWAWVKSDHPNDSVLVSGFGGPIKATAYAVVCGRSASLKDDVERKRFSHRRSVMKVEGHPALVLTYDEMVGYMEDALATLNTWS
jgi:hypothetical protein